MKDKIIFCFLGLTIIGCFFSKNVECFQKSNVPSLANSETILWNTIDNKYSLRVIVKSAVFATELPDIWVGLFIKNSDYLDSTIYHLYDSGHSFKINGNIFYSYKQELSPQNSFEGWYQKSINGDFLSLEDESTLLIYENKLLYKKEQQNFQRVVNKKFVFDSTLIQRTQELDYKEQGLFKLKGGQLLKVSSDANDIFSIKNGFFYVPKPGTGVKHLINMKDVIKEIDNSLLKKGFYPDKVYLH